MRRAFAVLAPGHHVGESPKRKPEERRHARHSGAFHATTQKHTPTSNSN